MTTAEISWENMFERLYEKLGCLPTYIELRTFELLEAAKMVRHTGNLTPYLELRRRKCTSLG